MRRLLAVTVAFGVVVCLSGMAEAQGYYEKKRDAKKAEAFVKNADWTFDYEKALAKSKETNKPVLAYFTRSYAR